MIPALLFAAAAAATPTPPPQSSASAAPPSAKLTLLAAASNTPWSIRIENTGTIPYKLTADARLLVLDITPPGATAPVRCVLPADMRPEASEPRALVVLPQRAYVETFDPRMYCFAPHERAALVPGASVVAHFGWPSAAAKPGAAAGKSHAIAGPFVIIPIDGVQPNVAAAKEIVSSPWTVPAAMGSATPTSTSTPTSTPTAGETLDGEPKLSLELPASGDTETGGEAWTTLTLHNESNRPVTLLFRIETLGFDVLGPTGMRRCGEPRAVDSPIRELFTTIPAHGRESIPILLSALCPSGTLDDAGLYSIRPMLDTRHASGTKVGFRTFDGMVIGQTPELVRVRHARHPSLPERPVLE